MAKVFTLGSTDLPVTILLVLMSQTRKSSHRLRSDKLSGSALFYLPLEQGIVRKEVAPEPQVCRERNHRRTGGQERQQRSQQASSGKGWRINVPFCLFLSSVSEIYEVYSFPPGVGSQAAAVETCRSGKSAAWIRCFSLKPTSLLTKNQINASTHHLQAALIFLQGARAQGSKLAPNHSLQREWGIPKWKRALAGCPSK